MKFAAAEQHLIDAIPTLHRLVQGDARDLSFVPDESIHLVVTSPPYWTLKRYNDSEGQMGHIKNMISFLRPLLACGPKSFGYWSRVDASSVSWAMSACPGGIIMGATPLSLSMPTSVFNAASWDSTT